MKKPISLLAVAIGLIALFGFAGGFYVLPETQQAIITRFGEPVGKPITSAGLHLKIPFIQKVNRIEKRVLEWDGPSAEMATKDKLYIVVDAFGRWRISDPLMFFLRLRDERSALSRLDDILGSEMRNTVARHELVELVRSTKGRKPVQDQVLADATAGSVGQLPAVEYGRLTLEREIADQAREKLKEFGVELLDLRFKRVNYNTGVSSKIFDRMISERRQIADRFRSEGAGEAARILGSKERDLKKIESEAYRKIQGLQGKADAEASAIYAEAFNKSPEAREFYAFQRSLEVYRAALQDNTTAILTTNGGLFKYLKDGTTPGGAAATSPATPGQPPAPAPAATVSPAVPTPVAN